MRLCRDINRPASRSRYNAIGLMLASVLAACGNPVLTAGSHQPSIVTRAHYIPSDSKSWTDATSSGQELLYVAGSAAVNIYTFPQAQLIGSLSGLNTYIAQECTDSNGNIFILTNSTLGNTESLIYEYSHGASVPTETLTDPGLADSCSVDSATGNLAVANALDQNNPYSPYCGDVAIYTNAQGSPHLLYSKKYVQPIAITYAKGNLYIVSSTESDGYELAQVAVTSGAFSQISLDLGIRTHPTPVLQWDGKHVTLATVDDPRLPLPVYRLQISGREAHIVAVTKLASRENRPGLSAIEGGYAVAADNGEKSDVALWNYPKGGKAFHTIKQAGSPAITGLALSEPAAR